MPFKEVFFYRLDESSYQLFIWKEGNTFWISQIFSIRPFLATSLNLLDPFLLTFSFVIRFSLSHSFCTNPCLNPMCRRARWRFQILSKILLPHQKQKESREAIRSHFCVWKSTVKVENAYVPYRRFHLQRYSQSNLIINIQLCMVFILLKLTKVGLIT